MRLFVLSMILGGMVGAVLCGVYFGILQVLAVPGPVPYLKPTLSALLVAPGLAIYAIGRRDR